MALAILSSALWRAGGAVIAAPQAGEAFWLGLAWGPGEKAAVSTDLSITGATIDDEFAGQQPYQNPLTFSSLKPIFLGWHPDSLAVWLDTFEAAWGIWQVTLPLVQAYSVSLGGITGSVSITPVSAPAAPVRVTLTRKEYRIIASDTPSVLCTLTYDGTYPAGGFTLDGPQMGLILPLFGMIQDTPTYRFVWTPNDTKLRVYQGEAEVSGDITFTTQGLFQANSQ